MAGNPLASLPGLPQRPSLARSSASETRLTQPGIEAARSRKLNSAPTAAFRIIYGIDAVVAHFGEDLRERQLSPRKRRSRQSTTGDPRPAGLDPLRMVAL